MEIEYGVGQIFCRGFSWSWLLSVAFKWIFSRRFRLELTKKTFEKDKLELDKYLESCDQFNRNLIHPVQFQYATNIFLGTAKFHYILFKDHISNMWNFNKYYSDLNYSFIYINQIQQNNVAYLEYCIKEKYIKIIKLLSILIFILVGMAYIGLVTFEMCFLEKMITNHKINKDFYSNSKVAIGLLFVIIFLGASFFGGKAAVALSLKSIFNIRDKSN